MKILEPEEQKRRLRLQPCSIWREEPGEMEVKVVEGEGEDEGTEGW